MMRFLEIPRLDLRRFIANEPPSHDWVWPGFLAGSVGALIAPGATGKSYFALQAAIAIACGGSSTGDLLGLNPSRAGRVMYLAGEDPVDEIWRRMHAIGVRLCPRAREAVAANVDVVPTLGLHINIMEESTRSDITARAVGARLIIIDTLSRVHHLDENSNSDMARLVSKLERISVDSKAAILYLHHVSKASAWEGQTNQQQAARGASALIDNVRWCGYVCRMSDDESRRLNQGGKSVGEERRNYFVRYGVSKQNYGKRTDDRWFERKEGGVLLPAELSNGELIGGQGRKKRRHREQA